MIESDFEFQEYTVKSVASEPGGWSSVTMTNGWSIGVQSDKFDVEPQPGETIRLYGRGIGYPVRGIIIGARLYQYETAEEHEASQAAMRERLRVEDEERDRKFRESEKPPLAAFEMNDPAGWAACVETNSTDGYSYECCRYAAAWASLMELRIREFGLPGQRVEDILATFASHASHEADTSGVTGFMYGCAVGMLARFWVHGEALRRWHNKDTQLGTEGDKANETGGVLNPALLAVGGA